jgi:hypothetical protein
MIRRNPSLPDPVAVRFGVATLFLLACAPVSEPAPAGDGGSPSNNGGSIGNSGGGGSTSTPQGGNVSASGGYIAMGGYAMTGGASTVGGSTAKGGASATGGVSTTPTGGTATTTTGGVSTTPTGGTATTATGGVATGSGGATTSGCGYTGTPTDSLIFKSGQGTSTKGGTAPWKGYAYTYIYGTATITPATSSATNCFTGASVCANGTVPAADTAGAGLGWNIAQSGSTVGSTTITGSVTFNLKGAAAGMRVALGPATGDDWCYQLKAADATAANSAAGLTLKASEFTTACYGTEGKAYAGGDVASVKITIPGSTAGAAQTFNVCLIDIEPS